MTSEHMTFSQRTKGHIMAQEQQIFTTERVHRTLIITIENTSSGYGKTILLFLQTPNFSHSIA
uniref:Uncharacterized protein n=1 Tax=Arundo donax TaxID=35708 RepID=A0A0A9DPX0_ARUDO